MVPRRVTGRRGSRSNAPALRPPAHSSGGPAQEPWWHSLATKQVVSKPVFYLPFLCTHWLPANLYLPLVGASELKPPLVERSNGSG